MQEQSQCIRTGTVPRLTGSINCLFIAPKVFTPQARALIQFRMGLVSS